MRKAVWMFSAPLVAGSLAWAMGMADEGPGGKLLPIGTAGRTPPAKAQKGSIYYFSRNNGEAPPGTPAVKTIPPVKGDVAASDAVPDSTPQRYTRNRLTAAPNAIQQAAGSSEKPLSTPNTNPKNRALYHDLFETSDAPASAPVTAAATTARPAALKQIPVDAPVVEECA